MAEHHRAVETPLYQQSVRSMISMLQNMAANQRSPPPPQGQNNQTFCRGSFNGFMAKRKLRSNIAEFSENRTSDAYIDSGSVAGVIRNVRKGIVKILINGRTIIEAYHAPEFQSNILTVVCRNRSRYSSQSPLKVRLESPSFMSKKASLNLNNSMLEEWHQKFGHPSPECHFKLSQDRDDVPKFDCTSLDRLQCAPCMTAKARRAPIIS
eukprot:IDg6744t1